MGSSNGDGVSIILTISHNSIQDFDEVIKIVLYPSAALLTAILLIYKGILKRVHFAASATAP